MLSPALIKPIIGITTGLATSRLTGLLIRNNVHAVTTVDKLTVLVGSGALGSLAGAAASNHIVGEIEKVEIAVKAFKEARQKDEE